MSRRDTITQLKNYFVIQEFVSPQVYDRYGDDAWQFLSTELLETILYVRTRLNRPITINNWHVGGPFTQRGLRDNMTPIYRDKTLNRKLYLSGHVLGMAVDFDVKGMLATEVRYWLLRQEKNLPHKIRLEDTLNMKPINWVHLDVKYLESNPKVYLFNV